MTCLVLFPAVEWSNPGRDLFPIPVSGAKPSNMGHTSQGRNALLALSAFDFLIETTSSSCLAFRFQLEDKTTVINELTSLFLP